MHCSRGRGGRIGRSADGESEEAPRDSALEDVDASRACRAAGVLARVDAHPAEEALERVGAARRDGDVRDVADVVVVRQAQGPVGLRVVDARLDAGQGVGHSPLAELHDERDVRAGGGVLHDEVPRRVRLRGRHRGAREERLARVARHARLDGRERLARHVGHRAVERVLPGRVEDLSADGRRSVRTRGAPGNASVLEREHEARRARSAAAVARSAEIETPAVVAEAAAAAAAAAGLPANPLPCEPPQPGHTAIAHKATSAAAGKT